MRGVRRRRCVLGHSLLMSMRNDEDKKLKEPETVHKKKAKALSVRKMPAERKYILRCLAITGAFARAALSTVQRGAVCGVCSRSTARGVTHPHLCLCRCRDPQALQEFAGAHDVGYGRASGQHAHSNRQVRERGRHCGVARAAAN